MPRLAWLTDLHLNFATEDQILALADEIREAQPDALLIGGDLGEAESWEDDLHQLHQLLDRPLYFVLGNHDYYRGSLYWVRRRAEQLRQDNPAIQWLPACGVVSLDEQTALIGHGGWGDARAGRFSQSNVLLNDYFLITELRTAAGLPDGVNTWQGHPSTVLNAGLEQQLKDLGDETARLFREVLPPALADHQQVIVLMHVPPFREACWHDGKTADDNWAPHFCCIAAGEVLLEIMEQYPHRRMTVLCGHTHGEGEAKLLPNLVVHSGKAEYGKPALQRVINTANLA